ncbi:MAG: hypothetical protein EOP85_09465 [Verrucomicrobiaceae bacterium]|nr:MAG: hypothetical protein EOP85_09465 [Verrucomicrobiaceae bacterium]
MRLLELPVEADLCKDWDTFAPENEVPTYLAVWRAENGGSARVRLDPVEFVLLARLRTGGTLSDLFTEPTDREPTPEEVSQWFANWQARRWIARPPTVEAGDFAVVRHRETKDIDWDRIDKMGSQARAMED